MFRPGIRNTGRVKNLFIGAPSKDTPPSRPPSKWLRRTERSLSIREKLLGTRESCTELLSGLYCANNDSLCACIMFVSHTHGPHVWWHSFLKLSSSYYYINRIPSNLFLILEELNNRVTKNEFHNRAIACVEHEKLAVKKFDGLLILKQVWVYFSSCRRRSEVVRK